MFGKVGEMKKMYDKYKALQKALQNLVIRAKEWKYISNGEEVEWAIVIDITGEMKLRDLNINDTSLLDLSRKDELEELIAKTFQKAQNKAQEVVAEKTKEILWFDPNDMASMMAWGGIPWLK